MRILWITNNILEPFFPYVAGKPTKGGSWIDPLFYGLSNSNEVKIGMISPVVNGEYLEKSIDGISYYSIPCDKGSGERKMDLKLVDFYLKAVKSFNPSIIHVHGVEKNFALLRKYIDPKTPIVCSIQGIINSCNSYLYQSTSDFNYKKYQSIKNWLGRGGIDDLRRRWNNYLKVEEEIFLLNKYFIGRTLWDKSQTLAMNSNALYFHGEELLRKPFYESKWKLEECQRNSIFISSGSYSLKGLHVLLKAVHLIKRKYPNVKVFVPLANIKLQLSIKDYFFGEDYAIYISSLVRKLKLSDSVVFLKRLSAFEMAAQFSKSHVFTLPSYIENSPNSLGEAMIIGTPSITAYTGGVSSMVENEVSTLSFPIADFRLLAYQIDRVFSNDELALSLSNNAKQIAQKRHNCQEAIQQYFSIYEKIVELHKSED